MKETLLLVDDEEGIRNKDRQVELVVEISADITEINRLQEELRNTQQRYQQLFDEVPCYITVQDKELNINAANKLFKKDCNCSA